MWIELHDTFLDHVKVKRLARALDVNKVQARGHLVTLWLNVLRHATDGCLDDWSTEDLADFSEWSGNAAAWHQALLDACLLVHEGDSLLVNDWSDYAHHLKAAKVRAQARDRKRKQRERQREHEQSRQNGSDSGDVTYGHAMSHDVTRDSHACPPDVTLDLTRPDLTRTEQTRPDQTHGENLVKTTLPPLPDTGLPPLPSSVSADDINGPSENFIQKQSTTWPLGTIEQVEAFIANDVKWQMQLSPKQTVMLGNLLAAAPITRREADYAASVVNQKKLKRQRNAGLFAAIIEQERDKLASLPKPGSEHAAHEAKRKQAKAKEQKPSKTDLTPTEKQWRENARRAKEVAASLAKGMDIDGPEQPPEGEAASDEAAGNQAPEGAA